MAICIKNGILNMGEVAYKCIAYMGYIPPLDFITFAENILFLHKEEPSVAVLSILYFIRAISILKKKIQEMGFNKLFLGCVLIAEKFLKLKIYGKRWYINCIKMPIKRVSLELYMLNLFDWDLFISFEKFNTLYINLSRIAGVESAFINNFIKKKCI